MKAAVAPSVDAVVVEQGTSAPLGAEVRRGGVNFSVFSKDAERIAS